ncbi:hypothetical protein GMORB2_2651 [Geosmithia morbida]|uniref:Uncharacterized protein n=1 Tax=Geosmithia morbida TaxID=1094350 RepID=A0A9P5CYN8_9HYPO|nr:uncharacterized protein GMORB2_2651 [Geosmithia morbida]KAF4120648.1 hypothetical protein GMORB2_2651 [Geosmithia morbida]
MPPAPDSSGSFTAQLPSISRLDHRSPPPPPTLSNSLHSSSTTSLSATTATATIPHAPLPPPHNGHDRTVLPPLSSLTGGELLGHSPMLDPVDRPSPPPWSALNPPSQSYRSADSPNTMDIDASSNSAVGTASPDTRAEQRAASVSLDDPDVWLAAKALGELRADFVSSPPATGSALSMSPSPAAQLPGQRPTRESGPLFNLLTASHPLLATTIEGATSAYGGAKNFSPRFKSGAEYVEGYLTPIANTVGSVGRVTGVEGGVRWILSRRQDSDSEAAGGSKKRRKVDASGAEPSSKKRIETEAVSGLPSASVEVENSHDSCPPTPKSSSRLSIASTAETLPAYDDMRSPAYTETMDNQGAATAPRANAPWKSRILISTSGLSVAMSDESLRSLKYCLRWLRWANHHMGGVIGNLKTTVEQYEKPEDETMSGLAAAEMAQDPAALGQQGGVAGADARAAQQVSRAELARRINALKGDVLKTLQDAINTVSRYAGGALPENARVLVHRHLTSLPQRFRLATLSTQETQINGQDKDSAVRDGAHKVLVLAKEGLDMVTQVSAIVDGTIVSAEEWCERMGRKRPSDTDKDGADGTSLLPQHEPRDHGVKMG